MEKTTALRKMEKGDIEICGQIHYDSFYGEYHVPLVEFDPEISRQFAEEFDFDYYFSRFIDDTDKYAFCVLDGETIIGYMTALEIPTFNGNCAVYIDSFAIVSSAQRKGHGTAAMKQFLELFPENTEKRLLTEKKRPAYKMYEKLGFCDLGMSFMSKSQLLTKTNQLIEKYGFEDSAPETDRSDKCDPDICQG